MTKAALQDDDATTKNRMRFAIAPEIARVAVVMKTGADLKRGIALVARGSARGSWLVE
jgi:hypothetical protein